MRGKRGISAIVATVLVILVTVAAISIVWLVIIPVVKQGATFDDVDTRLDVVKSTGYTFYDPLTDILYVQVKRGSDDNEMIGMDIVLVIEGNSETFTYNKTYVPGPNQAKTIVIEAGPIKPEEIRVNPVVNDGGTIKRSSIVSDSVPGESEATELMDVTPVSERDLSIPAECESNDDCESGDVCYEESCVTPAPCPTENSSVCVGTNVTFDRGYGESCEVPGSIPQSCDNDGDYCDEVPYNGICGASCTGNVSASCVDSSSVCGTGTITSTSTNYLGETCGICDSATGINCEDKVATTECGQPVTSTCEDCGDIKGAECSSGFTCDGFRCVDNDMVAWWEFEGDATDFVGGNDFDCSLCPSPTASGKIGSAYEFEGSASQSFTKPVGTFTFSNKDFSVGLWFKSNDAYCNNSIIIGDIPGVFYAAQGWYIGCSDNKFVITYGDGGGWSVAINTVMGTTDVITDNQWHFIIGVYDMGGDVSLYLDGSLEVSRNFGSASSMDANRHFRVGVTNLNLPAVNAAIDEVRIWERALTSTEVSDMYDAEN